MVVRWQPGQVRDDLGQERRSPEVGRDRRLRRHRVARPHGAGLGVLSVQHPHPSLGVRHPGGGPTDRVVCEGGLVIEARPLDLDQRADRHAGGRGRPRVRRGVGRPRAGAPRRPPRPSRPAGGVGLLRHVRARCGRPARRPHGDHPLGGGVVPGRPAPVDHGRARPHLRARRRRVELGRGHRGHRPHPRPRGRRPGGGAGPPRGPLAGAAGAALGGPVAVQRAAGLDRGWLGHPRPAARVGGRQPRRRPVGGGPRRAGRVERAPLRPSVHRGDRALAGPSRRGPAPRRRPPAAGDLRGGHRGRGPTVRLRESGGPAPGLPAPSRHHAGPVPPQLRCRDATARILRA